MVEDVMSREGVDENSTTLFQKVVWDILISYVSKKLDLNDSIIKTNASIFFRQLILPMYDPERSGITEDGRMTYYSKLEE